MAKKESKPVLMRRNCFMCNGTGEMCDVCGEAINVCHCDEGPMNRDCEDCEGTGIASADLKALREAGEDI